MKENTPKESSQLVKTVAGIVLASALLLPFTGCTGGYSSGRSYHRSTIRRTYSPPRRTFSIPRTSYHRPTIHHRRPSHSQRQGTRRYNPRPSSSRTRRHR